MGNGELLERGLVSPPAGDRGAREKLGLAPGPESRLIEALVDSARAGGEQPDWLRVPLGDDAVTLELPPRGQLVLSSDATVEEIHFRRAWTTWETVGYRAIAVALSDLAAMAARPLGVLVSLVLPPELGEPVAASIGRGIGACLRDHGGHLLGGDVGASPGPVMVDVTAVGQAAAPVPRSGACPGDELWVTGDLGGAAAAVADLQRGLEPPPEARRRFERPTPRLKEASWLVERTSLHALIDISDGLARDVRHLATVSGVGVEIELAAIPTTPSLQSYEGSDAALHLKVAGGEDYELLMSAGPGALGTLAAPFAAAFGVPLTRIGSVVEVSRGVRWVGPDGSPRELEWRGFDHFHEPNET